MAVLYSNNASTTLSASITNVATSLSVAAGTGSEFPAISGGDYFYATLTNTAGAIEIIKVTARATDTMTVVRGQDGTTAVAWASGDLIELRVTKAMLDDIKTDTKGSLSSANVTTALGYTPYNSTNPSGYTSNTGTVTSVSLSLPAIFSVTGSPVTTSGTLSASLTSQTANYVWAAPNGVAGAPTFRALVSADLPTYTGSITSSQVTTALGYTPYNSTNPSGYITGITSSMVTTALGYTPYNAGANTVLTSANYSSYALPLAGGTLTGNIGAGVAPSSWGTGYKALDAVTAGASFAGASYAAYVTANAYNNGTNWLRKGATYRPAVYSQFDGAHTWSNAATGAADSSFTLTTLMTLDASGNLTATANVTAYSDERLKKDWAQLPVDFVERLASVKAGTYTRIDNGERHAGASAQDVQALLPEAVLTDKDGFLSLAYGNAALVAAVKLAERVLELERRIEKLEAKNGS